MSAVLAALSFLTERRFHRVSSSSAGGVEDDILLMTWCYAAGGWIADEPAMAASRRLDAGVTYVYRPFDDLYVSCDPTGATVEWPELQEAEIAEIAMLPPRPWIPIGQISEVPYDLITDFDRDRRRLAVPVGSSQPPQPPGSGAAAAASAESRPPQQLPRLEAALAALPAGGGRALRNAHGYGQAQAIAADHDAAVAVLEGVLLRALAPPPPAAEALALLDLLALADPWVAPIGSGRIHPWSPPKPARPAPMPRHVADILLDKAVADGTACPITMELLTKENGAVTSCGHLFEKSAVTKWVSENGACPSCRQPCSL